MIDPYDYDLALRTLREIARRDDEPQSRAIARVALAIIEPKPAANAVPAPSGRDRRGDATCSTPC